MKQIDLVIVDTYILDVLCDYHSYITSDEIITRFPGNFNKMLSDNIGKD